MGVGSAWGSREELLHPRDSHGRFRTKWKMAQSVVDALMNILDKFNPRTFGSQNQANQYLHNLSQGSHGKMDVHRFLTDFHHTNAALRAGKMDPSTAKFVKMMDDSEVSLPNDLILSKVVNPDAFGLDAQTIHNQDGGLEDWTGKLIADRGYSMANIGPEVPNKKPGQITMRIATPAGTKVNLPRKGVNDSGVSLKHDQELRITKVTPDGVGGYYMMAVATQRTPGETPIPHGGAEAPNIPHTQREANITSIKQIRRKPGEAGVPQDVLDQQAQERARQATINPPPTQTSRFDRSARLGEPSPSGPTTTGPQGPPPRQEPIAHPGIGGGGTSTITPRTTPEQAPEHAPVQPISLDFRRAARNANLSPPANGPRRAEWRRAYEGVANGKRNPDDVLRELEKDIEVNTGKLVNLQNTGNTDADPNLPGDIRSQRDLADLIRREHGFGPPPAPKREKRAPAPKKEAPKLAPVVPIKRAERTPVPESAKPTKAPVTLKAPEAPAAAPAKKAARKATPVLSPETRGMTATQARQRAAVDAMDANPIEGDGSKLFKELRGRLERGEITPSQARTAAKKIGPELRKEGGLAHDAGDHEKGDRLTQAGFKFEDLGDKLQESGSVIHTDKYRRKAEAGAPSAKPETVADLKKRAKESGVKGYSKMNKAQLQEALNAPKTEATPAPVKAAKAVAKKAVAKGTELKKGDLVPEGAPIPAGVENLPTVPKSRVQGGDLVAWHREGEPTVYGRVTDLGPRRKFVDWEGGRREPLGRSLKDQQVTFHRPGEAVPAKVAKAPSNRALESAAVKRQAEINRSKGVAKTFSELDTMIHSGASDRALTTRMEGRFKLDKIDPKIQDALRKAQESGDRAKLRSVMADLARKEGLTPIGTPNEGARFDPSIHEGAGDSKLTPGQPVEIVSPGYRLRRKDGEGGTEDITAVHARVLGVNENELQKLTKSDVKTPAAEKKIETPDRGAHFRDAYNKQFGEELPPGIAGKAIREIRDDINRGTITPNDGMRKLETEIGFNKADLADLETELRAAQTPDEKSRLRKEIKELKTGIGRQEASAEWMRKYFAKEAPAVTPQEIKMEVTPEQAKALEVASAEDIRRGAEKIGIKDLQGNTKEEVFQDFVRKMAAQELARRAAKKAAVKKVAAPKAPATPKPDLAESPYKRIDTNALAEGLNLRHPEDKKMLQVVQEQLDGTNTSLGKNATPSQIGQNLEKWTGGPAGPTGRAALLEAMNARPVQHLGETNEEFKLRKAADEKEVAALRERGNEWMRLAERLKNTRRTRKEHAPETSTKEPKLTAPEKADIAKVAEATGIPETTLAKKAVAKKVAEAPPKPDAVSIVNTLKTVNSREEAVNLLKGRTRDELKEVAKASDVPFANSSTKTVLMNRIVHANVGARLDREALRKVSAETLHESLPKELQSDAALHARLMDPEQTSLGDLTALEDELGIKRISLNRQDRVDAILLERRAKEIAPPAKKAPPTPIENFGPGPKKPPTPIEKTARATEVSLRNQEIANELAKGRVAKKAVPAKAAPVDVGGVVDRLEASGRSDNPMSREEAAKVLGDLKTKAQLQEAAKRLNVPKVTSLTNAELRHEIINSTVGTKLDSIATRGFRGDIKNPKPLTPSVATVSGKLSERPLIENGYGGTGGEVSFHPDGAIGSALKQMTEQQKRLDVDGEPLANVLGKLATDNAREKITTSDLLHQLQALRTRIRDEKIRNGIGEAIDTINAPKVDFHLPENTPGPLKDLMEAFARNPLARKGGRVGMDTPLVKRLQEIINEVTGGGDFSRYDMIRRVRQLAHHNHESEEGYYEMRRAVLKAAEELTKNAQLLKPNRG